MTPAGGWPPAAQLDEAVWRAALELFADVRRHRRTVVAACHVGPDGDALGSMLALTLGLRRLGVDVVATWGQEPLVVPRIYGFLPGQEWLRPVSALPQAPDVLLTCDTSSVDRLGLVEPLVRSARHVVVFDHHARGDGFGTLRLVDDRAAATATVVSELLRRLAVDIDADIATCLYTALTTDTGSFRFAATTPAVHELAAGLLRTGIDHAGISRRVWDTKPFGYVGLLADVLQRAVLDRAAAAGRGLVWTWTTRADLAKHDLDLDDVEGVIDAVRVTEEADVAVVCKQHRDGGWRVSTRSKGAVDVGAVCAALGGGGHRYAAGFTAHGDLAQVVDRLRAALDGPGAT